MGFGALRYVIRPVSKTLLSYRNTSAFSLGKILPPTSLSPVLESQLLFGSFRRNNPWIPASSAFVHSLTDTRFPKRRPVDKPRRKRAGLRPPGPYAWVKYEPFKPILPNQPNQGSVKRRNEKKRMKQKHTFIMVLFLSFTSFYSAAFTLLFPIVYCFLFDSQGRNYLRFL